MWKGGRGAQNTVDGWLRDKVSERELLPQPMGCGTAEAAPEDHSDLVQNRGQRRKSIFEVERGGLAEAMAGVCRVVER